MDKVQQIREKIESLLDIKEETYYLDKESFNSGRWKALTQIKAFIDSLPKRPASESLEEEIKQVAMDFEQVEVAWNKDFDFIARHFAEWQREKDIKLEKIDDLEEFAQKWAYSNYHKELDGVNCDCLYSGVKKGAEWQKQKDLEDSLKSDLTMPNKFYEKGKADAMNEMKETLQTEYEKGRFDMMEEMMKDAVETTIVNDWQYGKDPDHAIIPAIHQRIEVFNVGDKVEIIIVKTEQQ